MSIVKRNNLLFPSLVDELLKPDWFGGSENSNASLPAVNIRENELDYQLELAVPGRNKGDFNIEIDKDILTISSKAKMNKEQEKGNYTRREFSYASFKRSFTLAKTIDADKINAVYESGVLTFTLPKKEEALPKPKRMIELV